MALAGNGRWCYLDPKQGAMHAVAEAARKVACTGATPVAATNCLNFGNPEKPHVAWQLSEAVEGLAEACEALAVPVVGGNVSLYNEGRSGPIFPTPVVGVVGRLADPAAAGGLAFIEEGDAIALVGSFSPRSEGSELAKLQGRPPRGPLPATEPDVIRRAHDWVREAVRAGTVRSAHDIAEGGLAVALAESAIAGEIGAKVTLPAGLDPFAEAPGQAFLVSGSAETLGQAAERAGDQVKVIGTVGGSRLRIDGQLDLAVSELDQVWQRGLAQFV